MKKIAMLFPLIAGSCWGAGGIFVRTLKTAGFGNISIMCSRSLVSFCLLLIVLLLYDRSLLRIHLRDLPFFLSAAVNGYLLMNDVPGIGCDINEEAAARYPYRRAYLPICRRDDGSLCAW